MIFSFFLLFFLSLLAECRDEFLAKGQGACMKRSRMVIATYLGPTCYTSEPSTFVNNSQEDKKWSKYVNIIKVVQIINVIVKIPYIYYTASYCLCVTPPLDDVIELGGFPAKKSCSSQLKQPLCGSTQQLSNKIGAPEMELLQSLLWKPNYVMSMSPLSSPNTRNID